MPQDFWTDPSRRKRQGWGKDFSALAEPYRSRALHYRKAGLSDSEIRGVLHLSALKQTSQGQWIAGEGASLEEAERTLKRIRNIK